jgi:hypothetical protein
LCLASLFKCRQKQEYDRIMIYICNLLDTFFFRYSIIQFMISFLYVQNFPRICFLVEKYNYMHKITSKQ